MVSTQKKPGQEWPNDWSDSHWQIARIEAKTKAVIAVVCTVFFVVFPTGAAVYGAWTHDWVLFATTCAPCFAGLGWMGNHYFGTRRKSASDKNTIERF